MGLSSGSRTPQTSVMSSPRGAPLNRNLSKVLLLWMILWPSCASATQQPESAMPTPHDLVQDCLRSVWGKPVFWDSSAAAPPDPAICGMPADKLDDALKAQHLKAFHLPNGVLLTSDAVFTPKPSNMYYHWKTPSLSIRVQPLAQPESRQPTVAEMRQISDVILQRSHLPPLACPYDSGPDGLGKLALTIDIDIHRMRTGSPLESAIALVISTDPEHEYSFGAGRIVYGELRDGRYKYLWETPLLASSYGRFGYEDLLRNGDLQILVSSAWGISFQYQVFYAFDLEGNEITRQNYTCEAMDQLALDLNRGTAVCPIYAGSLDFVDDAKGPKALLVTNENDIKVMYVFSRGRYRTVDGSKKPAPPSDPVATARNRAGMQLMEQKNYEGAMAKFEEAAMKNSADPVFANNAGFAYYKMGKYEESLYWFNKTIEVDPGRAVAYLNLGDSLAQLNRNAEAHKAYAKYLELAPESKAAPEVKKKLAALPPVP